MTQKKTPTRRYRSGAKRTDIGLALQMLSDLTLRSELPANHISIEVNKKSGLIAVKHSQDERSDGGTG